MRITQSSGAALTNYKVERFALLAMLLVFQNAYLQLSWRHSCPEPRPAIPKAPNNRTALMFVRRLFGLLHQKLPPRYRFPTADEGICVTFAIAAWFALRRREISGIFIAHPVFFKPVHLRQGSAFLSVPVRLLMIVNIRWRNDTALHRTQIVSDVSRYAGSISRE